MSEQHDDDEKQTKQALLDKSKELERLAETIYRAAEGRRPLPNSLGEALKQIGDLAAESEEAITAHLDDAKVGDALEAVATALSALRSALDSLVVYYVLEGQSYETRTVAND
jgi:hypothetical protein